MIFLRENEKLVENTLELMFKEMDLILQELFNSKTSSTIN